MSDEVGMFFFFSSRRRHTRYWRDWSSDVCSSDLYLWIFPQEVEGGYQPEREQIGSGPFILQSVQPDVEVRLVQIGRGAGWGKGENSGGAVSFKKKISG